MSESTYHEPLALVIISSISIGIAAIFAGWIALDIILRRGWRTMMAIMIPVFVINALYLWPITLWTYLKYGRPSKPSDGAKPSCHDKGGEMDMSSDGPENGHHAQGGGHDHANMDHGNMNHSAHVGDPESQKEGGGEHEHHMHHGSDRPMLATVTIGVCHCGAGCVLGDIVGEWIVYGAGLAIGSPPRALWVEYLIGMSQ